MIQTLITDWLSGILSIKDDGFIMSPYDSDEEIIDDGYMTPSPDDTNDYEEEDTPSPNWKEGQFGENVLNYRLDELRKNPKYDGYNDDSMDNF